MKKWRPFMLHLALWGSVLLGMLSLSGCYQGRPSGQPPIHLNPNMDHQPKYNPQAESRFFVNRSAMRMPVPGTVAVGDLHEDEVYYRGIDARGDTVRTMPVPVTLALLRRGQQRFNIYCAPCHSRVGDGHGIVVQRGLIPPPTFHSEKLRNYRDGYIFNVISHGIRNMPAYGPQIPVADRWAIVAYFRALQRSQNASIDDMPEDIRAEYENQF